MEDEAPVGPSSFVIDGGDRAHDESFEKRETAGRENSVIMGDPVDAIENEDNFGLLPVGQAFVGQVNEDEDDEDVLGAVNGYTIGAPSLASPQEEGFLKGRFGRENLKLKNGENSHGFNGTLY